MKKFLFTIVALLAVSAVSAQSPRTIAEAQALYDTSAVLLRRLSRRSVLQLMLPRAVLIL